MYIDGNGFPEFQKFTLGYNTSKPVYFKFDYFELDGSVNDFIKANDWLTLNKSRIISEIGASDLKFAPNQGNRSSYIIVEEIQNGNVVSVNYTWHHHQDTRTLMLVKQDIHSPGVGGIGHSGGRQVITHNQFILNNGKAEIEGFLFFRSPF